MKQNKIDAIYADNNIDNNLDKLIGLLDAIYARQSVDKKDSISIETQIEDCKREITTKDYKVYADRGYSGKDTHRPDFEKMIRDIKQGLIKKVIVYKLDRISRSTLDFANIMDIFKKYNVDFVSINEKFDTSTPIGNAMLNIVMVFAQLERETIQMRILDNYYARGRKGFFLGGRTPYGFNKIKTRIDDIKTSTFENHPNQAPYLIEMYELYANTNMSLGKISKYLNDNNIPTASGGMWDSNKISLLIRSPLYVKADADVYLYYKNKGCTITNDISDFIGMNGCYLYGKRNMNERKFTNVKNDVLSIGVHEGLVDSNTWLTCQYKLDDNKQIKNSGKGKHSWLSGVIKCGYCNYAMVVTIGRGYGYFNCAGKRNKRICNGHSIPIHVSEIEDYVKEVLFKKIENLKNTTINIKENDIDSNKIKIQIVKIDKQISNLMKGIAEATDITMKYINDEIAILDSNRNELLEEMKKINIENNKKLPLKDIMQQMKDWENLDIENRKIICRYFINKIFVKDNEIFIDWNI